MEVTKLCYNQLCLVVEWFICIYHILFKNRGTKVCNKQMITQFPKPLLCRVRD